MAPRHWKVVFVVNVVLLLAPLNSTVKCQLDYRFYDYSCPNLMMVVRKGVWSAIRNETRMAASLLRLHFHDCIVNGCDASVLLDDTAEMKGEKNATPNRNSARGFEVIDSIKDEVEKVCPSRVSCADILALAAREAVFLSGGPFWPLPLGRKDSKTASEAAANSQIPSPFEPLENITNKFTSKGLSLKDIVVLSGGHTIGFAQCSSFRSRLFDFQSSGKPDPSLDPSLLTDLQALCPNQDSSNTNLAALDRVTPAKFDHAYYNSLVKGTGLLQSDQALMGNSTTAAMVMGYSMNGLLFHGDFGASMVRMAGVGVITGNEGEVRRNCRAVNG